MNKIIYLFVFYTKAYFVQPKRIYTPLSLIYD